MPVRKIKPTHRSITGKFPSLKTGSAHRFESSLERDCLVFLEFDCSVESYLTQPLTITYYDEGKMRRYTPDVLVHYKIDKKPFLCEVKYEAELEIKREELRPKFDAATKYALENGYEFGVLTEKQIRNACLQNIKFLSRYHTATISEEISFKILTVIEKGKILTPEIVVSLLRNEYSSADILYTLWQMVAQNILNANMDVLLSMQTELKINRIENIKYP